jgi:hypothetical protein
MTTSFNDYTTQGERAVARRLIKAALAAGYTISVYDGEETTVKRSSKLKAITDALATTGEDTLQLYAADPSKTVGWHGAGSFYLIWGNADDGSELIADHTNSDICNSLWAQAMGEMA